MELFWARGYEGATLEDLLGVMGGINPPSFYHAFGSKEALFREAVELYIATVGCPSTRALEESPTAREGVDAMLRTTVKFLTGPGKPHGCMLVRGAINTAPANKGAEDCLLAVRQQAPRVIKARLDRAVNEGELPKDLDTRGMAAFYVTVLHGLGLRAGDGASSSALMSAVEGAMAAWEPLTTPARARGRSRSAGRAAASQSRPARQ